MKATFCASGRELGKQSKMLVCVECHRCVQGGDPNLLFEIVGLKHVEDLVRIAQMQRNMYEQTG